jgi:dTMP kinase
MNYKYIALEGLDGCGKSTQAQFIADSFGYYLTREPGATILGKEIRELLLHSKNISISNDAELLLMLADRAQHLDEVVRPILSAEEMVVSDRSYLSSLAYQGGGRGMNLSHIEALHAPILKNTIPDLVLFIDTPVEIALGRIKRDKDRFESLDLTFYNAVRESYLSLANTFAKTWFTLDGTLSPEELNVQIRDIIQDK